jgi:hypothetical protein
LVGYWAKMNEVKQMKMEVVKSLVILKGLGGYKINDSELLNFMQS